MRFLLQRVSLYLLALKRDDDHVPWLVLKSQESELTITYLETYDRVFNPRGKQVSPVQTSVKVTYGYLESGAKNRNGITLGGGHNSKISFSVCKSLMEPAVKRCLFI